MSNFIYTLNGDILVFGKNESGQLGLCHRKIIDIPTLLINDNAISNIIFGSRHTIIYKNIISNVTLDKNNSDILVVGNNNFGQLGLGHYDNTNIPTSLMNNKNINLSWTHGIKNIICGGYHTIIHKDNGDVFVFGWNEYGQLGLSHNNNINVPTQITSQSILLMNNKNIICGLYHTIIYDCSNNGDVFVFGNNKFGQLGLCHYSNINTPTLLLSNRTIKNIIAGGNHTIIYKDVGDVLVFGCNMYGQLGLRHEDRINVPTLLMKDKNIKIISCGEDHTIIYKDNGDVFAFGYNSYGQLGLGHHNNVCIPTLLMNDKSIKNIICNEIHTLICKDNGDIFIFGGNYDGRIGLGHRNHINVPTLLMNNSYISSVTLGKIDKWS